MFSRAWVPIAALDQIAALDAVQEITPPDYAVTKTGSVNTEGDAIHRADLVRAFSGLTGKGVRVGRSYPTAWTSGPTRGAAATFQWIWRSTLTKEAAVTRVPPCWKSSTTWPRAPHWPFPGRGHRWPLLRQPSGLPNDAFGGEGADVIVDDLGYYREPYFEDGAVALAAADAVAGGAVFVSAAGNYAQRHYEGEFVDGGNRYHDFDAGAETDTALRVRVGSGVSVFLQWSDKFGESANDYDLYACVPGLKPTKFNLQNDHCKGGTRIQDGDDNPSERVFASFVDETEADVYIRKFDTLDEDKRLELFIPGGAILKHGVPEGGIVGHPAVAGVLAVGAIRASDPGNDDPEIFSDRGPSEIYFPNEQTRNKPDVMGIDGASITGSGGFPNPFFGTSAAAPHVAGIAALVMEAQRLADPTMTKKAVADAVTQKLRDTAVDLGVQDGNGYNETFGYGRADAFAAVDSLDGLPPPTR